ncbi:F-box protein At5g46170-like [Phalaenopsis equestris]|uniref:F-box protein At5g46170-like n=1 Tax=Phalaenopsis equestris TaxID=78828 RepID=UPI0009E55D70|nr:F-box protein At5g46170-like [Phalaenopsis equestris]
MSSAAADLLESHRWCVHRLSLTLSSSEYGIDNFDRLPDSILIVIFNRIGDVKALGRCCVVSRRFHALVPLVDNVVVRVDCVIPDDPSLSSSSSSSSSSAFAAVVGDRSRGVFSHLARFVFGGIVRPFYVLGQILSVPSSKRVSSSNSASSSSSAEVSHHSPSEVLKNFKEIRRLRIELPAGELGVDEGVLLKWKADFGSTLDSCVILGAASVLSSKSANANPTHELCASEDNGSIPESFYMNGGLKLRVLWTISSLIAASARHYLLQSIISDHETLEFLDLTDADGQGVLTMDRCQLQDLRVRPVSASGSSQRTLVPALSMRLWYAPLLEMPGGLVLKGATLVAIRPSENSQKEVAGGCSIGEPLDLSWVSNALEEPYRSAAKMLVKRRTYCLEMNSF